MNIDEAFKEYTRHKAQDSRYEISCVLGLWSVDAPTEEQALIEAKHYFRQYYFDGEYDGICRSEE